MIFLALRYLFAKKKQTCLILLGIFIGTCGFVTLSGLLLGWQEYFIQEIIYNDAHLFIRTKNQQVEEHGLDRFFYSKNKVLSWLSPPLKIYRNDAVENPMKWYQIIKTDPRVYAYSPRFTTSASLTYEKREVFPSLVGCYPENESYLKNLKPFIIEGKFENIAIGNNRLAIGEGLSRLLGVKLNQNILVSVAQNPPVLFKVAAIFKTSNFMTDNCLAYGLLDQIQELAKKPHQINEIAIKLHDHTQASKIASSWFYLGEEKIESWDKLYSGIFKMCLINDAIRFLSSGIIMLVAGFGIYNVLNMTVMQKKKDIAILRSIGYSSRFIMLLFLSQGILLGVFGSLLGMGFGYLLCSLVQMILLPFGFFPISFNLSIYIDAALIGIIFAGVSSLFPARFAKKMTPIEIIRSGAE